MTTTPIRRLIAVLGLVVMPLMAGAQPAPLPPIDTFPIFLETVRGDCSELNDKMKTEGVTDAYGVNHPNHWGWTTYQLLVNGLSIDEHKARNGIDLLQSFGSRKATRQDSSGTRTCLHASGFDIEFGAQTSITRIDWDPLFPLCPPCATERALLTAFIEAHERKHEADIRKAAQAASSGWPSTRVIEACGLVGAKIVPDLGSKLMTEIIAQLTATQTSLTNQIKADADALHRREPYAPMNCSACRCQVPAECKWVTVSPFKMRGGPSGWGDVTLLSAAPPGGADVLLKTDNPMASVFSQINVPEGGTNQAFGITVMPVQQITRGFIYATRPGAGKICRADLWVYPPELVNFTTDKAILQGGEKAQGTVTLGTVAPAGGIKVTLDAGGAKDLIAPKDVVVTGGALEANFVIEAKHRTPAIGYSSNMIIAEWEGKTIPVSIEVH